MAVGDVDDVQRVAHGAGHDPGAQPDGLVVDHVEPGDPLLGPEVLAVGAGVDGRDRHHEAHPVDGGDQPAAERLGEGDQGLAGDQRGVRGRHVLGPEVGLGDMRQPVALQGGDAFAGDRPVPDVHRLGGETGGDADVQAGHARPTARQ